MSMETNDQSGGNASPPAGRFALVLALTVGITAGAAVGSFVVGPLLADAPAPECEVLADDEDEHGEASGGHGSAKPSGTVHMIQNLVLNPAQSGGTRFLVSTVAISVRDSAAVLAIGQRDSEVRDALLRVLGGKTVLQLTDMELRAALKEEVREELRGIFGKAAIRDIYFPQFVIQ